MMSDESWAAVCDSLETHPTHEVLNLDMDGIFGIAPEVLNSWMQVFADILKVNTSMHTIAPIYPVSEHELFRELVIPYLETNRLMHRLLAIQTTRPIVYRAKVLGRALLASRTNANSFWMLLSGNAEVTFPPTTATTMPAANLPVPTAVVTSNATDIALLLPLL
jgi:hypothetical protein